MKTLFAAILVALLGICGCDAASDEMGFDPDVTSVDTAGDEGDEGTTADIGFTGGADEASPDGTDPDSTDPDAAEEVEQPVSMSPVPIPAFGLEVRLTFSCTIATGYNFHTQLHVISGDAEDDLDTFHAGLYEDNDALNSAALYKGSTLWDGAGAACLPESGVNTYVFNSLVIPTNPNGYLITVDSFVATTKNTTPFVYFTPDVPLYAEVWCNGELKGATMWNPNQMKLEGRDALDVFFIDTSDTTCNVTTFDPLNVWCGGSETQCEGWTR